MCIKSREKLGKIGKCYIKFVYKTERRVNIADVHPGKDRCSVSVMRQNAAVVADREGSFQNIGALQILGIVLLEMGAHQLLGQCVICLADRLGDGTVFFDTFQIYFQC